MISNTGISLMMNVTASAWNEPASTRLLQLPA